MNRLLKYGLITFTVITLLTISIIVYTVVILDPNSLKPMITRWVKEKTQRTLTIDGHIQLTFYPKLGINLGSLSLSEYKHETVFVSVAHAHMSLALLPLLKQQLVADEITIKGLKATIIRFKNGRTNIDDLMTHDDAATQNELYIDQVQVTDTTLIIRDEISKQVATLTNLNLETGQISLDTLNDLRLNTKGQLAGLNTATQHNLDIKFDIEKIQFNDHNFTSDKISFVVNTINPEHSLSGQLSLSDITHAQNEYISTLMVIDLTSKKGAQFIQANIKSPLIGTRDNQRLTLPELTADLSIVRPDIPHQRIQGSVSGYLLIDAEAEKIETKLIGTIEDSTFKTIFTMIDFTQPVLNFNVEIDELDMDRFLPLSQKETVSHKQAKNDPNLAEPFKFSFLKDLNANGLIHIGVLQAGDIQSSDIQFEVQSNQTKLDSNATP